MTRQVAVVAVIAVFIVSAVVASILYSTRHNKIELTGNVLKVRSQVIDDANLLVLADLRVTNPSTQDFIVEDVAVYMDEAGGPPVKGDIFSETDARRIIAYYPVLGKKYNDNLTIRQKIRSGESIDRMIAVRFPGNEARLQKRKGLRLVVTEVDGATTEIAEKL